METKEEEVSESQRNLAKDYARRGLLEDKSGRWSWCDLTIETAFDADMLRMIAFPPKSAYKKKLHPHEEDGRLDIWMDQSLKRGGKFPQSIKYFFSSSVSQRVKAWGLGEEILFFISHNL